MLLPEVLERTVMGAYVEETTESAAEARSTGRELEVVNWELVALYQAVNGDEGRGYLNPADIEVAVVDEACEGAIDHVWF